MIPNAFKWLHLPCFPFGPVVGGKFSDAFKCRYPRPPVRPAWPEPSALTDLWVEARGGS